MNWSRSYILLLRWNALRLHSLIPLFAVIQAGLALGVIVGFSYLIPEADPVTTTYLVTGGVTVGLVTVGLVIAPQLVAQRKTEGSFDFERTLPVPRTAALAADVSLWTLGTVPGLLLALLIGAARFDLHLHVSPLAVPAIALVALTATAAGYALAYALPPMAATMLTQLLVFFVLMFSPVNFPAQRLPGWLQAVHTVLPIRYMAQVVRDTLVGGHVAWLPFAVLGAWSVGGLTVTYRLMIRRA